MLDGVEIDLGSFWDRFGVVLGLFWDSFVGRFRMDFVGFAVWETTWSGKVLSGKVAPPMDCMKWTRLVAYRRAHLS